MTFDMANTTVILNGHTVTGWSDDGDALGMPTIDLVNITRGADGLMNVSSTGEKGGPVTLKLLPNSKSTAFFMQAVSVQRQGGALMSWSGLVRYNDTGVIVALVNGVIQNAPLGPTVGKGEAANHEFVFEFEQVTPDYSGATF